MKETEQKVFLNCVAWDKNAEFVSKHFVKGQECVAEGRLVARRFTDKKGKEREVIELVVERMHFCGPKREDAYAHTDTHAHADWEPVDEAGEDLPFN